MNLIDSYLFVNGIFLFSFYLYTDDQPTTNRGVSDRDRHSISKADSETCVGCWLVITRRTDYLFFVRQYQGNAEMNR